MDQLLVSETIKDGNSIFQRGQKKADLAPGRDLVRPGMDEMFRQLHVMRQMELLPANYRTDEARAVFAASFDDCGISLLFPWPFRLPEPGTLVSSN